MMLVLLYVIPEIIRMKNGKLKQKNKQEPEEQKPRFKKKKAYNGIRDKRKYK